MLLDIWEEKDPTTGKSICQALSPHPEPPHPFSLSFSGASSLLPSLPSPVLASLPLPLGLPPFQLGVMCSITHRLRILAMQERRSAAWTGARPTSTVTARRWSTMASTPMTAGPLGRRSSGSTRRDACGLREAELSSQRLGSSYCSGSHPVNRPRFTGWTRKPSPAPLPDVVSLCTSLPLSVWRCLSVHLAAARCEGRGLSNQMTLVTHQVSVIGYLMDGLTQ